MRRILAFLLLSSVAQAADLQWSGIYRFEGYGLKNTALDSYKKEKNYLSHHLILKPKIVAADGIIINGRFDILNDLQHPNSQVGQFLGNGPGDGTPTNAQDSNVLSDQQESEMIQVTHLYMTWLQEHGALIVGRAPVHFGLGMSHNAGEGMFDHWYDSRDLVGYKVIFGNFYLLPMYGKVEEGGLTANSDIIDWMVHAQYDNPETDLSMGLFYQQRVAKSTSNDAPVTNSGSGTQGFGADGSVIDSKFNSTQWNLFAGRDSEKFKFMVEAAFLTGDTGVASGSSGVGLDGFGIAGEVEWRPENSKWKIGGNFGTATGDDPTTDDKFEGFFFDRNYDFTMLMFQQSLGQVDLLHTTLAGRGGAETADTETISNVLYASPYAQYKWHEKWSIDMRLTWAQLNQTSSVGGDYDSDLGYELGLGLNYSPNSRLVWKNQFGYLMTGNAWKGSPADSFENENAYGFATKAAISF